MGTKFRNILIPILFVLLLSSNLIADVGSPLVQNNHNQLTQNEYWNTQGIKNSETWITAPSGARLYTRILRPNKNGKFPAVILVPGGLGAGAPMLNHREYKRLSNEGNVLISFNAEGRGDNRPRNLKSDGTEDCNGFHHQDDLKAVIEYVAGLPYVDWENIGVATFSYGITMGAGALGRYPDLPVKYLIDGEGPHDNRVTTHQEVGHEHDMCGHLSLVSDPSPGNQAWWAEREAVQFIGQFQGAYMRVQAECDHSQPCGFFRHAIDMNNAAIQGGAPWARMNGNDLQNPINQVYDLGNPSSYPEWIPSRLHQQPGGTEGVITRYIREMAALP